MIYVINERVSVTAHLGKREGALRLKLKRMVRAELHLIGLGQVASAEPDRLACRQCNLVLRIYSTIATPAAADFRWWQQPLPQTY